MTTWHYGYTAGTLCGIPIGFVLYRLWAAYVGCDCQDDRRRR